MLQNNMLVNSCRSYEKIKPRLLLIIFPQHAFLEETRTVFFWLANGSRDVCCTSDTSRVGFIDRNVKWTMRLRSWSVAIVHDCLTSLNATISILLHRVLTGRQGLDVRYGNLVHDIILTAKCWCRDARQLLLIVQRLFTTPVENVTIRFCGKQFGEELKHR